MGKKRKNVSASRYISYLIIFIAYFILIINYVRSLIYEKKVIDYSVSLETSKTALEKENNRLEKELEALRNDFNSLQKENEALQNQVLAFSAEDNFQAIFHSYLEIYSEETQILDYIPFPYYVEDSGESTEVSIDSSLLSFNYLEITGIVIKDLRIEYNNELVYRYPINSSKVITFECESGIKYRISIDSTFYEQDNPIVTVTSINGNTYDLPFSFYESPY